MQSCWRILRKTARWPIGPLGRKGWTLIEILIVIAVAVILTGVSIPFFGGVMETYRLNGAARQVVSEIRMAQSLAVSKGGVYGFHWGGDPIPTGRLNSEYRLERDGGTCAFPPPAATTGNADVITEWTDLARDYRGVTITSILDNAANPLGGVMYNARGASVNTCVGVNYPVTIRVSNVQGDFRDIEVRSAGSVRMP